MTQQTINELKKAKRKIENGEVELEAAIRKARSEGHTWREIGAATGIQHQNLFRKYGKIENNSSSDETSQL